MKNKSIFLSVFGIAILALYSTGCQQPPQKTSPAQTDQFSFLFMTDIHLQREMGAQQAFNKVIDTANRIAADFVMTGGDLVFDVLRGNLQRSDSLFEMYKSSMKRMNKPVYHVMGNHELFGIYPESDVDSLHVDFNEGLYRRHLGPPYYSFDHKGWHFMVLKSALAIKGEYIGMIDAKQKEWIVQDLAAVKKSTPVVVVTHIPFVSAFFHWNGSKTLEGPNRLWIHNREEILGLFSAHDLRLVLQGHVHWLEDINMLGKTRFITGGAVAGRPTWRGTKYNEEGFLHIHVGPGKAITWDYIDYGWTAIGR